MRGCSNMFFREVCRRCIQVFYSCLVRRDEFIGDDESSFELPLMTKMMYGDVCRNILIVEIKASRRYLGRCAASYTGVF